MKVKQAKEVLQKALDDLKEVGDDLEVGMIMSPDGCYSGDLDFFPYKMEVEVDDENPDCEVVITMYQKAQ